MSELLDKRVLVCNYLSATPIASINSKAYVQQIPGDPSRIKVLTRSRSGRWVSRWESSDNLTNFRLRTLPPEHPLYSDIRIGSLFNEQDIMRLPRRAE